MLQEVLDNTGERDVALLRQRFAGLDIRFVAGNCDFDSEAPARGLVSANGVRIFYTHGHRYGVKYTYAQLVAAAAAENAQLALFGHTHRPVKLNEGGIVLLNPGSVALSERGALCFGIVDVSENGDFYCFDTSIKI